MVAQSASSPHGNHLVGPPTGCWLQAAQSLLQEVAVPAANLAREIK